MILVDTFSNVAIILFRDVILKHLQAKCVKIKILRLKRFALDVFVY